jgi:hypothetical protein
MISNKKKFVATRLASQPAVAMAILLTVLFTVWLAMDVENRII